MVTPDHTEAGSDRYSATPRRRRGNRRATGGSSFTGAEPKIVGLAPTNAQGEESNSKDERDAWLKEQRPPHYQNRV
ncbi:hypothetical protein [Rothia endophytica]|uniref:Uncharacterized protein n=1 Tax=Rothia endophytica TaxID=1324766 RepID=A0ABP9B4V5_9MICC